MVPDGRALQRVTPIPAPVFPPGQTSSPSTGPIAALAPIAVIAATAATASPAVAAVQRLPSTSTDEPLSPPLMLGLTLAGVGLLLLLLRPVRHA